MSGYAYEIHKIINNPTSTTGFNPALNSTGTRMIIGDGQLPDFSTGITPPSNGMFKVYDIKHDSRRHIRSFTQLGPAMTGSDLEGLGNSVGMDSTGNLIIASSNKTIFNIYEYNQLNNSWNILFSPGENHGISGDFFVGGFRYDSQFRYIITAALFPDINGDVTTRLLCYQRVGPAAWSQPFYTYTQDFLDMFIRIRGLSSSDILAEPDITGPVIAQLQVGDAPNHVVVSVIALKSTEAVPRGNITMYNNSDDYQQIAIGINKAATRICITFFKDNQVQGQIFTWDSNIEDWVPQILIQLDPVLPFEYPLPYVYLSDEMSAGNPEYVAKLCLSMNYSISADPIYGIYEYNSDSGEYEQKVSFSEKLTAVAGNNPLPMGFLGSYVSDDFNTIVTSFVGPDDNPSSGPPFGPAYYATTPAPGITNVGDIMSEGISLALFIKSTNVNTPTIPNPSIIPPDTAAPAPTTGTGISTTAKTILASSIAAAAIIIFLLVIFM